jgi:hypothetical protein
MARRAQASVKTASGWLAINIACGRPAFGVGELEADKQPTTIGHRN